MIVVSALCLSRGDQRLLDAAHEQWTRQTRAGHEFVVVHDGRLPLRVPGVEVIVDPSANLGQRRNAAWRAMSGDVGVTWDDDDEQREDRLAVQLAPLDRGYTVSLLQHVTLAPLSGYRGRCTLIAGWPQTLVARRAAVLALGGYSEVGPLDEDTDLVWDLAAACPTKELDNDPSVYTYRQHANNVTSAEHWAGLERMSREQSALEAA